MKGMKHIISVFLLLLFTVPITAQEIPDKPNPPRLVVDYIGLLTQPELRALENKLVNFNDTTSNQIVVVIVDRLFGYTPEGLASRIGDKWGVGQDEFDNGVVVLLMPKIGNNRGEIFISIGDGLEGAIPDITTGQIVDWEMIPRFKNNDYYGGLDAGTTVLMELAAGEYNSDEYAKSNSAGWWAFLPFIIFIAIFILISRASRRSRTIGSNNMSPWAAFWLGSMIGGSSGSSWGGSSGSSWGGGSSFGGFGGGSFGGGGAGGSW